ncbi:MAG TPA: hypothetical protein DHU89_02920 [Flavobacteriales bacterium]|nr:hypothetical protein [Flavobacteriales bacterium]|tara:strand:+ start:8839 stop:10230 length:1392 start_codon:yes stop_codon:yes gene_type:complete
MIKILTIVLVFISFGASAQQRLIATQSTEIFDEEFSIIDSTEYIYSSLDGAIFSNEPKFLFDQEAGGYLYYYVPPAIKWDLENNYQGETQPLTLQETYNNTIVGENATVSESDSRREEFSYDAAGNLTSQTMYYFDQESLSFIFSYERTLEFDVNNNKIVEKYSYLVDGDLIDETIDSLFYDESNNLTRLLSYNIDGNGDKDMMYVLEKESFILYSGADISSIQIDYPSEDYSIFLNYSYVDGLPTAIDLFEEIEGELNTTPETRIFFAYGENNKVSSLEAYDVHDGDSDDGDSEDYLVFQELYSYNNQDLISVIATNNEPTQENSPLIFSGSKAQTFYSNFISSNGESAEYLSDNARASKTVSKNFGIGAPPSVVTKFYYQSTVGLNDLEMAEAAIFPNPSSDFISISINSEIKEVAVFGLNGSIMLKQTGGDLDISNLPAGVYIVKVKTSTGVAQSRFVKQ